MRIFDYKVGFEVHGQKMEAEEKESSIHKVIEKVRQKYPDACMFVVRRKVMAGS